MQLYPAVAGPAVRFANAIHDRSQRSTKLVAPAGLALGLCQWDDGIVGDDKDTELADTLAEVGRRVGQAMTDALERIRPAFDALAEAANRPEVRAVLDRAEKAMRRRPCLCFCSRAHPADSGVCERFDAVITRQYSSDLLGEIDVPLCAPCAAAQAARQFTG
jgi:hypothetical protein